MLLEGLHIPVTTPFHSDGRLHPGKLAANVARYSKTPAAGLIVLGPTGEPTSLSDDETREALRAAASTAAPEKVLLAGIVRDSVRSTLDLAAFAHSLDYDAVLIGMPSILTPASHLELLTWFQTIADASPLPVVLLSTATRAVPLAAAAQLATQPNILGLLDACATSTTITELLALTSAIKRTATVTPVFAAVTARMQKAARPEFSPANLISADSLAESYAGPSAVGSIDGGVATSLMTELPVFAPSVPALKTRTRTVGFQLLSGATPSLLDALQAGAIGIAPAFAAPAPQACYEVFAAWKDSDLPLAAEKQARLTAPAHLVEPTTLGTGALKFACDLNGYFGGIPRLPLLPPSGATRTEIEARMQPLHN